MMFERFTPEARAVVVQAREHARRLGHRYVGGEHLLLAIAGGGQPASAVLSAHGVTPERVEEEIIRRVGLGAGAGLFAGVDAAALAAIGIDLDAVRARIEASFGPRALTQAARILDQEAAETAPMAGRWPLSFLRRRPARPGSYQPPGRLTGAALPFTAAARKMLELSFREALARHDSRIRTEHVALAIVAAKRGLVPDILSAAGASVPALRTGILNRYRQAS